MAGQQNAGSPIMAKYTWDHVHLRSPDPEATAAWFEKMLGAEVIQTPYQGLDHFGLTCSGIDAIAADLKAKGVEFTREPATVRPGVRVCFLRGPQGISIELLERTPA
jgi:catechol 2,3-dioxygenase-like lactoylglutathione lyase family enzyme